MDYEHRFLTANSKQPKEGCVASVARQSKEKEGATIKCHERNPNNCGVEA